MSKGLSAGSKHAIAQVSSDLSKCVIILIAHYAENLHIARNNRNENTRFSQIGTRFWYWRDASLELAPRVNKAVRTWTLCSILLYTIAILIPVANTNCRYTQKYWILHNIPTGLQTGDANLLRRVRRFKTPNSRSSTWLAIDSRDFGDSRRTHRASSRCTVHQAVSGF